MLERPHVERRGVVQRLHAARRCALLVDIAIASADAFELVQRREAGELRGKFPADHARIHFPLVAMQFHGPRVSRGRRENDLEILRPELLHRQVRHRNIVGDPQVIVQHQCEPADHEREQQSQCAERAAQQASGPARAPAAKEQQPGDQQQQQRGDQQDDAGIELAEWHGIPCLWKRIDNPDDTPVDDLYCGP